MVPGVEGVQEYAQLARPLAGCHVLPPSIDTSMPPTTPPPASVAVPLIVTGVPAVPEPPVVGVTIVDDGAVVSVEAVAVTRPDCSVFGCTPMSAKMLTVACCMLGSGAVLPRSWLASRPHAHWMEPALKTRAPLECLYIVR